MSHSYAHPFHIVDESPWPISAAIAAMGLTSGLVKWFYFNGTDLMIFSLVVLLFVSAQWWRDVRREGSTLGFHTKMVELGLRWGIILFIISEVFFFLSFFWAFFHRSLRPRVELGLNWPPAGIKAFNPLTVPLLNTNVLLSSGVTVTWAHHRLLNFDHKRRKELLENTVLLGIYFTMLQAYEYWEAPFSLSDSVFGSTFFIATGFHGLHVIVGTLFLAVSLVRLSSGKFRVNHHFGLEAAAWYWHFVDVVWLFLFVVVYYWRGV